MSIPLLPGYRREAGGRGQFHKSHTLGRSDVVQEPRNFIAPASFNGKTGLLLNVGPTPIDGARAVSASSAATSHASTGRLDPGVPEVESRFAAENRRAAAEPFAHLRRVPVARDFDHVADPKGHLPVGEPRLPSWVEYDNKVLRFAGYFKEAVHASSNESFRIRPILLYFYLSDDSLHIAEPPTPNSGIPQAVLVRRHRVPKNESGVDFFLVDDLYIGAELAIYGKRFRLTAADAFTRAFFEKNGAPLEADEQTPLDAFAKKTLAVAAPAMHFKPPNPLRDHAEAALGKTFGPGVAATQQFLANDGKVLRFYATWTDTKMFGERRAYRVHFFLADNTVEVLEVTEPNSGYGSFPNLLKRSRLPRDHTLIPRDLAHMGAAHTFDLEPRLSYVTEKDLRVGGTLDIHGRLLTLCGADAFTRQWYFDHYGTPPEEFDSRADLMTDPPAVPPKIVVPPPNGFGSDEDSLGSFLFLVPKQPKTDQKKLHECDGILLRFYCMFVNPSYVDKDRKFILTYFLANDTLMIFETFERNAGHIGGKYLDRARIKNVRNHGEWMGPADLFIGNEIEVFKQVFVLLEADDYTKKFMDANPDVWNANKGNVNNYERALKYTKGVPFNAAAKCYNTGARPF